MARTCNLRSALLLCVGLLSFGHPASTEAQPPAPREWLRVTSVAPDDALNLRAGPNPNSPILAQIPPRADNLRATGATARYRSRLWLQIDYAGKIGWVNSAYVAPGSPPLIRRRPAKAETPRPPSNRTAPPTGTGFFVSAHDIVTNNHVIKSCGGVAATGDQPLVVVAQDKKRDLALLRSRDASTNWLPISSSDAPLGASVFVLGYPYGEFLSEGVTATRGVLSSRTGLFGEKSQFTLSAQIQPGNSGGPVMNQNGEVIGVVVARLSDGVIANLTGTIPQNVNYAVGRRALEGFLAGNGSSPPPAASVKAALDLTEGIPRSHEASAISIRCFTP